MKYLSMLYNCYLYELVETEFLGKSSEMIEHVMRRHPSWRVLWDGVANQVPRVFWVVGSTRKYRMVAESQNTNRYDI